MGVPDDEGSVRKRPRLSLRTPLKPEQNKSMPETTSTRLMTEDTREASQSSSCLTKSMEISSECIDLTADFPSSPDPVVAPVASLHNLGNTCFLNCMLEVLRYTPGFLGGLEKLQEEIAAEEGKLEKESPDENSLNQRLTWQVVKNTCALYKEMEKREDQHKEIATADASSMAVRPMMLLDNIRELNPMFEGHFQHDAQELLRCLLCFIEDAEKDLLQIRDRKRTKQSLSDTRPDTVAAGEVKKINEVLTEKGAASENSVVSLKGGEGQSADRGVTLRKRQQNDHEVTSSKKNVPAGTSNISHDGARLSKDCSTVNGDCMEAASSAAPLRSSTRTGRKQAKAGVSTPLTFPAHSDSACKKRKRSLPRSVPSSRKIPKDCNESRKRDDFCNSCDKSAGACKYEETDGKSGRNSPVSSSMASSSSSQCHSRQAEECQEDPSLAANIFEKLENKLPFFSRLKVPATILSRGSASQSGGDASSPNIRSMFSLNTIKRLGMRGQVIFDSLKGTNQNTEVIGAVRDKDDVNNNNAEDVNNNIDVCVGDKNCSNSAEFCATSACVLKDETMDVNLFEIPEGSHAELLRMKVSPVKCSSAAEGSADYPTVISSPSKLVIKSPVKSPIMVEHCDEICFIPDNEVSHFESTIDSVTRKYLSSLSPSTNVTGHASQSTLSSSSSGSGPGLYCVTETPASSRSPSSPFSSHHVLEPDKEINITVFPSPRKLSGLPLPSDDKSEVITSESGLSHNKLPACLDDRSKLVVSTNNTCLTAKQRDSVLSPRLSLANRYSQSKKSISPQSLQTLPNVSKSHMKVSSLLGNPEGKTVFSLEISSGLQAGLPAAGSPSYLEVPSCSFPLLGDERTALRSPGAYACPQPKVELKKCDWLGVSPVKSISARKAIAVIDRLSRTQENSRPVRRRILYDDSSHPMNCGSEHVTQTNVSHCFRNEKQSREKVQTPVSKVNNSSEEMGPSHAADPGGLKKPHPSMLNSVNRSRRSLQPTIRDHFSNPSNLNRRKGVCLSVKDIQLKKLSVTLTSCDWLLASGSGQSVSARRALQDMKKAAGTVLQSKRTKFEEIEHSRKHPGLEMGQLTVSEIKPQTSASTLPEHLFGGIMMHRTKCLECEMGRERQEVFMDIGVPVRSEHSGDMDSDGDDDDDDDCEEENNNDGGKERKNKSGNSCLSKLMGAASNVERLLDANKYYCEHCVHYVEAERSSHYLTLPTVLTLHLKRFSANSRLFGGVSKIIDKVTIPQNLPCLRYQCKAQCLDSCHRYSLFAIVTHSGTSILHGHYRAYVKVQSKVNPSVFSNLSKFKYKEELADGDVNSDENLYLMAALPGDSTKHRCFKNEDIYSGEEAQINKASSHAGSDTIKSSAYSSGSTSTASDRKLKLSKSHVEVGQKTDGVSEAGEERHGCKCGAESPGSFWLECDDECITVMDEFEFEQKLSEKDGCLIGTPYVLFYHKLLV